jgi:transcriptional regulator with XRE-family HTH domain
MDLPDLRSALIRKIQELDISQREATEAIGVSQQALSSWVSGDSIPSRRQSPRLAKWLDLPEEAVRRMRLKAAEISTAASSQHALTTSRRTWNRSAGKSKTFGALNNSS